MELAQMNAMVTGSPLLAVQEDCPVGLFQCPTSLGPAFVRVCCRNGQTCALDEDQNAACCPSGLVCTGNAPGSFPTDVPVSYVSNSYFSFPYAPTTFDSSGACSSAVSACSANHDACLTGLQGGDSYGVTIVVPGGGGVTVDGLSGNVGASATSICSSLSSEACSDLEATSCGDYAPGDSDSGVAAARLTLRRMALISFLSSTLTVAWLRG